MHKVSIPERVLEALKLNKALEPVIFAVSVSIPERVLEALKHTSHSLITLKWNIGVSIPERVLEALKPLAINQTVRSRHGRFNP